MFALRCQGCGREVAGNAPAPWRCPAAGDGGDHVLGRVLPAGSGRSKVESQKSKVETESKVESRKPKVEATAALSFPLEGEENPFLRYRALTLAHSLFLSRGRSDEEYVALVRGLDSAVARVDGRGFRETRFGRSDALSDSLGLAAPGGVFVKDETGNVAGSHKGRHLMGLALFGEVRSRLGLTHVDGQHGEQRLAIASCGNAALAAAVIARAWEKSLDVFIPPDANPRVVERLSALGASVHVCLRQEGVAGDPCYHAFRRAVEEGALPFCCQGSDNGLNLEGGETLAWELISPLLRERRTLDRLFVQVGGGALASACVQGFRDAALLGAEVTLPRLHPVQTRGAFPLRRAWEKLAVRLAGRFRLDADGSELTRGAAVTRGSEVTRGAEGNRGAEVTSTERGIDAGEVVRGLRADAVLAESLRVRIASPEGARVLEEELGYAAAHRAEFMWPWESEPKSVAHGILDDETYDWLNVVRGTLESGGFPIVASEELLREAHALGHAAGFCSDATGTSGLAGALVLRSEGLLAARELVAVLFTGAER